MPGEDDVSQSPPVKVDEVAGALESQNATPAKEDLAAGHAQSKPKRTRLDYAKAALPVYAIAGYAIVNLGVQGVAKWQQWGNIGHTIHWLFFLAECFKKELGWSYKPKDPWEKRKPMTPLQFIASTVFFVVTICEFFVPLSTVTDDPGDMTIAGWYVFVSGAIAVGAMGLYFLFFCCCSGQAGGAAGFSI